MNCNGIADFRVGRDSDTDCFSGNLLQIIKDRGVKPTIGFRVRLNSKGSGTRRTMSGGMEAGALEVPRRLFGLARNVEHGGSVTILATALVDTGSQMDQLIFQEFKGTGNSEVILDRKLAEQRIFPAINILESGTRKEERLYGPDEIAKIALIRRGLADRNFKEATEKMLELIKKHPTNEALLASIPAV